MIMTKSEEDYIKLLYQPSMPNQEGMKVSSIAKFFGYSEQSVHEMIKRLRAKKLLDYVPYKSIHLTTKGRDLALKMIRAHRIWEVFLYEKLGYRWDEVHALSEVLEHINHDSVVERLYQYLKQPSHCPHGNRIPVLGQEDRVDSFKPLNHMLVGDHLIVKRVEDAPELLSFLTSIHVHIETRIEVVSIDTFNELMQVSVDKNVFTISFKNASRVFGDVA
jgi:DtxR family Mn-dependent transcriptional regulator